MSEILEQLRAREDELKRELLVLQDRNLNLKRQYEELKSELNEVKSKIDEIMKTREELQKEIEKMIEKNKDKLEKYEELRNKRRELRKKLREVVRKTEEELKEILEHVGARGISDIEKQIMRIETRLQTLPLSPNREKEYIERLKQLYSIKTRIEDHIRSKNEYQKISNQIEELAKELETMKSYVDEYYSKVREIKSRLRDVTRYELKPLLKRKREIIEELNSIRKERKEIISKIQETEKSLKDLEKILIALDKKGRKAKPRAPVSGDVKKKAREIYENKKEELKPELEKIEEEID